MPQVTCFIWELLERTSNDVHRRPVNWISGKIPLGVLRQLVKQIVPGAHLTVATLRYKKDVVLFSPFFFLPLMLFCFASVMFELFGSNIIFFVLQLLFSIKITVEHYVQIKLVVWCCLMCVIITRTWRNCSRSL